MADYKVTIVFDYSTDKDVDEDELHDAIRESFDTIDLEFTFEAAMFDENDVELDDETMTVNVNADALRRVEVEKVPS
jgi:hypothetical protein